MWCSVALSLTVSVRQKLKLIPHEITGVEERAHSVGHTSIECGCSPETGETYVV